MKEKKIKKLMTKKQKLNGTNNDSIKYAHTLTDTKNTKEAFDKLLNQGEEQPKKTKKTKVNNSNNEKKEIIFKEIKIITEHYKQIKYIDHNSRLNLFI